MRGHEEGLIKQYVHEIQALGVRAETGEDVTAAVNAVITKAVEHFRIVKSSDPQANLSAFKHRLAIAADIAHSAQPSFKHTLQHAADTCPIKI